MIEQCDHQDRPGSPDAVVFPSRNTNARSQFAASLMLDDNTMAATKQIAAICITTTG